MRYAVIAVVLAGCATTPQDVVSEGTKTVHALKLPADKAAICMARNVENHSAGFVASNRPVDSGHEVVVRIAGAGAVVFVATVNPAVTGSRATVWYRGWLTGGEDARAAMLAGC